jgi:hypothetical protein
MVVLSVLVPPTLWMKATRVPCGTAPLSAKMLSPPAGFWPMRSSSFDVQPVIGVFCEM